jgi:general secretion pathway protein F
MPIFEYSALDRKGKATKGSVDAENARAARQKLKTQGIFVTSIEESLKANAETTRDIKRLFQSDSVSTTELAIATRQLATLAGAGIPIVEALSALSEQVESINLRRIIIDVREKVQEGSNLAKAMALFPKAFPKLYVNMVSAGEASGTLEAVFENLADYLESQVELRRQISSSMFYPILMLAFCFLVVIGLLVFVVPSIVDIFIKQGAKLPLPTTIMLGISNFLVAYWPLMIAMIIGLVYLARWYYKSEKGRAKFDLKILSVPLIGTLILKINCARISRTLGTLLQNGVGLLEALTIVRNIVNNVRLAQALENARDGVREGKSLSKELARSGLFPSMMIHMIGIGETSGRLEGMLAKAGKSYENDVNATLSGLTSLIEPLMMIGLGGVVFSIVISIMLPMVDMINLVQK